MTMSNNCIAINVAFACILMCLVFFVGDYACPPTVTHFRDAELNGSSHKACKMYEPRGGWIGINKVKSSTGDSLSTIRNLQCYCMKLKSNCAHLRLERGELTVLQVYRGFQTRMKSSLLTIYDAVNRNPAFSHKQPIEFVIEVSDGQIGCDGIPVFMMTTRNDECITVPDFTFGSWIESSCPPGDESHSWRSLYGDLGSYDDVNKKIHGLVWSGAATGRIRREFLEIFPGIRKSVRDNRIKFQIQATQWQKNSAAFGDNLANNCMTLREACGYKYQLYLPGNTYSSNLKYKMMCGSVVMAAFDEWKEWWYEAIQDSSAIVRVDHTRKKDVVSVLDGNLTTEDEVRLAANAVNIVKDVLSPDTVACYWETILLSIPWGAPSRPKRGIPLVDVLMMDMSLMHFSAVEASECM